MFQYYWIVIITQDKKIGVPRIPFVAKGHKPSTGTRKKGIYRHVFPVSHDKHHFKSDSFNGHYILPLMITIRLKEAKTSLSILVIFFI